MRFSDIPGQNITKQKLINGIKNNHVAHAQLFYGVEGTPNLALALAYIAYINCESPTDQDSCGHCPSCTKLDKLVHPDLHLVFPVAPTDKIKGKDVISENYLKEWRTFATSNPFGSVVDWFTHYGFESKQGNISKEESKQIIKSLSLKAFEAKYKVMLIWLPEYMHPSAANGILKILEEPPPQTLFILVSNDYEKLLSTIISRTQLVNIPLWEEKDIAALLEKTEGINPQQATSIARKSGNNLTEARKLLQVQDEESPLSFPQWVRNCWKVEVRKLVEASNGFAALSKIAQKAVMMEYIAVLRQIMLFPHAIDLLSANTEEGNFIADFSKAINFEKIDQLINEINKSTNHLESNANAKIIFFDTSVKVIMILKGNG